LTNLLKGPFPYFGGKSTIADRVWKVLGSPKHYIEPFFGSGAVLLARPGYNPQKHVETVCDKDGFIANVWRALQFAPDEVARWCDWPVNHADLNARRRALIKNKERLLEQLAIDEQWHDPVMAGYWIWATSCWIGHGLTQENQADKRPHVLHGGKSIHALGQVPFLAGNGKGITAQRPHIFRGEGVHALSGRPDSDMASDVREPYNTNIYAWFRRLSERLRYVRVVCGDWTRVCGGNWQDKIGDCGIFFDPPYGDTDRDKVYQHDSCDVAGEVRAWALERGKLPSYRIVIAGYDSEGAELLAAGWSEVKWKASGGYGNTAQGGNKTRGQANRKRECLWLSPYCLKDDLFTAEA
jgi:DNA adenine methylase